MEKLGFTSQIYNANHINSDNTESSDKKWPNLIISMKNESKTEAIDQSRKIRTLQFNGHLDTVTFNENQWQNGIKPLEPKIIDDKMYGRGAADMKGGVACIMSAMRLLKESNIPINGNLQLWFVPDEEIDAHYGARYMVKEHLDVVNSDATIIAEPTGQKPIKSPVIIMGEKGSQWFELEFIGAPGHGSMPKLKSNVITKASRFIVYQQKLKLPNVKSPLSMMDLIKALLSRFKIGDIIRFLCEPATKSDPYNEDGVGLAAFFKTTVSMNIIHGGLTINMIPATCRLKLDIRVLPGIKTQEILSALAIYAMKLGFRMELPSNYNNIQSTNRKIMKRPIDIKLKVLADAEGTFEDPSSEFCALVADSFENVFKVKNGFFFAPGSSDATYMRNGGMRNVVLFGPNGQNTHSPNEFVSIDDLIQCTKVYLLTAHRYLK
jgi:succinyl-diaminopimelate desuccinylase